MAAPPPLAPKPISPPSTRRSPRRASPAAGRGTPTGSPLLSTGTVHARLVGRTVSGYGADAAGNRALNFQGSVDTDRMHGTYTDRTGETGAWAWDGPPPQ